MGRVCCGAGALRRAMGGALAPFFLWASTAHAQLSEPEAGSPGVHWQIDIDPPRVPNGWEAEVVFVPTSLRQRFRINARPATISGRIEGQVCRESDGTCALVSKEFSLLVE
jgi:hypothetical protein